MIPKILHFIWIGQNLPAYTRNAIKTFSHMNDGFQINLHHHVDINQNDVDMMYVYNKIFNDEDDNFYKQLFYSKYPTGLDITTQNGMNVKFSDCLRFHILNKYGGIYLDLDTFPIKPLEDLCKYSSFSVKFTKNCYDIFFMGFERGKVFEYVSMRDDMSAYQFHNIDKSIDYSMYDNLKTVYMSRNKSYVNLFKSGNLELGQRLISDNIINDYYIDHIRTNKWK